MAMGVIWLRGLLVVVGVSHSLTGIVESCGGSGGGGTWAGCSEECDVVSDTG